MRRTTSSYTMRGNPCTNAGVTDGLNEADGLNETDGADDGSKMIDGAGDTLGSYVVVVGGELRSVVSWP